jgi:hypothetical protein
MMINRGFFEFYFNKNEKKKIYHLFERFLSQSNGLIFSQ